MERIAVIGVGKMGLCFALNLEKIGYQVLGVDRRIDYVSNINKKTLKSHEPDVEDQLRKSANFKVTAEFTDLTDFDPQLIFISVDTAKDPKGGYDHRNVDTVLEAIFKLDRALDTGDIVIMSTTLPGYCDLKAKQAQKQNYTISYNPGFIAQGSIMRDQQYPDQVLIGEANVQVGKKIEAVYKKLCKSDPIYCKMSRLSAEITKLATNCFLTMKIAFANSIGDLATTTGAESTKILEAIGVDSRIGNKYLKYGFGYGGPCFPHDNRALSYFANQNNFELFLSEATDKSNTHHLDFQYQQYLKNYPEDETIHFSSVTYKPNTIILEESQQLTIAVRLARSGRKVMVHDNKDVISELQELHGDLFEYVCE